MKDVSLVVMLGGLSSRFGGNPKGLARIGPKDETLLEFSLNQALKNDFKKIIFVVSSKTEKPYKDYFNDSYKGIDIKYVFQTYDESKRDKPWGTNDALCSARKEVSGPFVVCTGDDIYGEEPFRILFNHLQGSADDATVGYKLKNVLSDIGSVNRGIFQTENGYVKTITETLGITRENMSEKGLSDDSLCSMALFGLQKETLNMLDNKLEEFKKENSTSKAAECFLPKELGDLISQEKIKMKAYKTNAMWIGVTRPEDQSHVKEILSSQQ